MCAVWRRRIHRMVVGATDRWTAESTVTGAGRSRRAEVPAGHACAVANRGGVLFRVAQEALANVAKHAQASMVVTLSYLDDLVMLDVRDNGVGFELDGVTQRGAAAGRSGFGLRGIRQRLDRVQGTLEIESGPGEGTVVNASVPALAAEASPP